MTNLSRNSHIVFVIGAVASFIVALIFGWTMSEVAPRCETTAYGALECEPSGAIGFWSGVAAFVSSLLMVSMFALLWSINDYVSATCDYCYEVAKRTG